jgi:hypothetical protein
MQRLEFVPEQREHAIFVRDRCIRELRVVRADSDRLQDPQLRQQLRIFERKAQEQRARRTSLSKEA